MVTDTTKEDEMICLFCGEKIQSMDYVKVWESPLGIMKETHIGNMHEECYRAIEED